jgi:hypothetical protein
MGLTKAAPDREQPRTRSPLFTAVVYEICTDAMSRVVRRYERTLAHQPRSNLLAPEILM